MEATGDPAFSMFNLSLKEDWVNNKKFCHRLCEEENLDEEGKQEAQDRLGIKRYSIHLISFPFVFLLNETLLPKRFRFEFPKCCITLQLVWFKRRPLICITFNLIRGCP